MKLIIGLGNPGPDYQNTRHNAGFILVDKLQKLRPPKSVVLKKSNKFMNESGIYVKEMFSKHRLKPEDLYIIHDDLDIKLGEFKIQKGRGPKDHNGIKSIDKELGTNDYWHVRIGIDNRPLDHKPMGEEYVLQNFEDEEMEVLKRVIDQVTKKLALLK